MKQTTKYGINRLKQILAICEMNKPIDDYINVFNGKKKQEIKEIKKSLEILIKKTKRLNNV